VFEGTVKCGDRPVVEAEEDRERSARRTTVRNAPGHVDRVISTLNPPEPSHKPIHSTRPPTPSPAAAYRARRTAQPEVSPGAPRRRSLSARPRRVSPHLPPDRLADREAPPAPLSYRQGHLPRCLRNCSHHRRPQRPPGCADASPRPSGPGRARPPVGHLRSLQETEAVPPRPTWSRRWGRIFFFLLAVDSTEQRPAPQPRAPAGPVVPVFASGR